MHLVVRPMQLEDFDDLISHTTRFDLGDDLVANPVPTCWPVSSKHEATVRANWHFDRQWHRFLNDKTMHFLKVVDADNNNEIASIARWHFYPRGYMFEDHGHWESSNLSEKEDLSSKGWNHVLHDRILDQRDRHRGQWIVPTATPCWILMHLVTRPSQRRKGAARLLVQWGIDKAEETGVRGYLEAGVAGVELYQGMGFEAVGDPLEVKMDEKRVFPMLTMVYTPKSLRSNQS